MKDPTSELRKLCDNPDMRLVLDAFHEADQVYHDALDAMGAVPRQITSVQSSAEAFPSFAGTLSTSRR